MNLPQFILASASPRRQELLQQLGVEFQVVPSKAEEVFDENLSPVELCQLNAHRKARSVAKKFADALVLGADTLVFLDNGVLGKPSSKAEAQMMISRLQGRTHQVVTGVSLIHQRSHRERIFAAITEVRFRPLTDEEIHNYLSRINPLDKAGAYAIQEHGELIVEEISGSFSNVVGLPVEKLAAELENWNS
ncbi:MAG TPA: Maf family protein [Verrucomicrobiota bacterium]|nr:Maf family protein [Verrucomicrobiota bacterium]